MYLPGRAGHRSAGTSESDAVSATLRCPLNLLRLPPARATELHTSALLLLPLSYKGLFRKTDEDVEEDSERSFFQSRLKFIGGSTIYAFRAVPALDVFVLLRISVVPLASSPKEEKNIPTGTPLSRRANHAVRALCG